MVTAGESRERDGTRTCRLGAIANVYHSEEGKTLDSILKAGMEEESFGSIRESAPLTLDTSKLPVSIGHNTFHGDVGRAVDCGEGSVEEDKVIANLNASGLVPR